jgi:hypothetical protein
MSYGGINSERAGALDLTDDGGYILAGSSSSFTPNQDMYIIKLNSIGSVEWSKTFHSFGFIDRLHSVKQNSDKGYYLAGYVEGGFGFIDNSIIRVDSIGNIIWAKYFGGIEAEEMRDISITADSGILVTGFSASFGAGAKDIQAIKFSESGTVEWAKTYGSFWEDFGIIHSSLSDESYLLNCATDVSGFYDIRPLLVKIDTNGNIIWAKVYSGFTEDWARYAIETDDNNLLITGDTQSYGIGGTRDIYLIKTDSSGNVIWAKAYGGIGEERGYSVVECADGNYVVCGYTNSFGFGGYDAFLMNVDLNGNLNWFYTYGGPQNEYSWQLLEAPDSGYVLIGGRSSNSLGAEDIYMIKTDKFGMSGCDFTTPNVIVFTIPNLLASDYTLFTSDVISVADLPLSISSPNSGIKYFCGNIPVELKSFNYQLNRNDVILNWTTATETNNMGFNILRNDNEIGFVPGAGSATQPMNYSFIDQNIVNGSYIYTLTQIDYDGSTEKVGEIEIIVYNLPLEYKLGQNFPNPFNPSTKIQYALPKNSLINLSVYSSLGERVVIIEEGLKEAGYYEVEFDGIDLPSGIYFYTILSESFTDTKKMLLLK